ncbi:MAG: hypothetical protein JRN52_11010 [Nitrososphaerota archaeon]|nr:hypothetical protein [Nitrososphaerota archaeon]
MSEAPSLQEIHDELKELRLLYERLIDRLIPIGEPTKEEKEAIESVDELVGEEELFRTLGVHDTNKA